MNVRLKVLTTRELHMGRDIFPIHQVDIQLAHLSIAGLRSRIWYRLLQCPSVKRVGAVHDTARLRGGDNDGVAGEFVRLYSYKGT